MGRNAYFELIADYVRGRDILDVGSLNHSFASRARSKDWVFGFLLEHAASLRGIDIEADHVRAAQASGFPIEVGDAETYVTDRPVDVVFAGDLIEHLSNPGAFLRCAHLNLRPDGRLVLVTPNTYGLRELYLVVSGLTNDPPVHHQHTAYYTPTTLAALARRHGFEPERVAYANIRYRNKTRWQAFLLALNALATRPFPRARQTMVMVLRKQSAASVP